MLANAYNEGEKLIIQSGGQGSGKTFSIMQLIFIISVKDAARIITVASYALPHLKTGAMAYFEKILIENGFDISQVKKESESKFKINKTLIEFIGLESNTARVTGNRRDILYINEANNKIPYEVFDLAHSRTHECTIIDFNPRAEFWFHEKIQKNFAHKFIKSSFLDNEYLPVNELENILSKKNKPGFENWWRVYGLGELGQLEGTIFENWHFGKFDESLPFGYAMDFGVRDPDTLVKCAIDHKNKKLYTKLIFEKTGLKTNQLLELIRSFNPENKLIIADSASPRTILDIADLGVNIIPVKKPPGSILAGIKIMQDFEIIIDEDSPEIAKEFNNYVWLDKKGEIPIDKKNHKIDPIRYYAYTVTAPKNKGMKLGRI